MSTNYVTHFQYITNEKTEVFKTILILKAIWATGRQGLTPFCRRFCSYVSLQCLDSLLDLHGVSYSIESYFNASTASAAEFKIAYSKDSLK